MSGNPSAPPPIRRPGGGSPQDGSDCDLRFNTQLASPVAAIVGALSEGEELTVELEDMGGVQVVAAKTASAEIAGSIVDHVGQLIRCIQLGNSYRATVVSASGGAVSVDVTRS